MIELEHMSAGYHGEKKLYDISLSFPEGQVTALIGPNGSGKSTLVMAAAGLLAPYEGAVRLDGQDVYRMPRAELARRVSFLPQVRSVYSIPVKTLVMHGRFPHLGYPRRYGKKDREIARAAMERVGILPLAERNMAELSGGERQKAFIAMTIAQDTDVVFMDEPTTYLDIAHQLELMELVRGLRQAGKTVVLVLHDLNLALRCCDHVAVLRGGRLLKLDHPDGIFHSGALHEAFGVRVFRHDVENMGHQYYFV